MTTGHQARQHHPAAFLVTPLPHRLTPPPRRHPPIAPSRPPIRVAPRGAAASPAAAAVADRVVLGGREVSALGAGTWAWGDRLMWGYGEPGGYSDEDLWGAYQECRRLGVTLFDTAEAYGNGRSEELCGEFGRRFAEGAEGAEDGAGGVCVATKYLPLRLGPRTVERALRGSLKRLGVSKVDLYQLHFPSLAFEERVWDELAELYQRGLVSSVGVSNYSEERLRAVHKRLKERDVPLACNQVRYSLLWRNPEVSGVMDAAEELGVKILAYSPLEQGILTGKYNKGANSSALPRGPRRLIYKNIIPKAEPVLRTLDSLAAKYQKSTSQVALNWVMCKGAIPIPGCKTIAQARENAGALGWRLSEEDVQSLDDSSACMRRRTLFRSPSSADNLVPEL